MLIYDGNHSKDVLQHRDTGKSWNLVKSICDSRRTMMSLGWSFGQFMKRSNFRPYKFILRTTHSNGDNSSKSFGGRNIQNAIKVLKAFCKHPAPPRHPRPHPSPTPSRPSTHSGHYCPGPSTKEATMPKKVKNLVKILFSEKWGTIIFSIKHQGLGLYQICLNNDPCFSFDLFWKWQCIPLYSHKGPMFQSFDAKKELK